MTLFNTYIIFIRYIYIMAYEWRQDTPTRNTKKYWCGNGVTPILEIELIHDV